ncbi:hypothetical protein LNQ03_09755 [Klebsiella pneumoniae subsp. pneumoniae]|nr:hypothetical protein [Klebsiella pneumoniae subsp. pneumoniae]
MFNASQQLQQIRNRLNGTSVGDETLRPTQQGAVAGSTGIAQRADRATAQEPRRQHYPGRIPCRSSVTTSPPGATGWSISYSCCRRP